jgi:peptide/nickel transport system permease protein
MGTYIIRRLLTAIIVILIVSVFVFLAMHLLPGDPLYSMFNPNQVQNFTKEQLAQIRHEVGLDRPLITQYFSWLGNVLQGDLGKSMLNKQPITKELMRRVPITAHIGALAYLVSIIVGIPLGIIAAIRRGTWLDTVVTTFANLGITIPIFWLGVMMIFLFGVKLHWLPVMGYVSPFTDFVKNTKQIIMPVFCEAIFAISANSRQARSSMLEVMRQDYIRTAWSKGFNERTVIIRHALKNSLIPVITLAGMGLTSIIGGSVLIETVFNISGMGRLAVDSLFSHDYLYVQGISLIMTTAIVMANLLVDISYGWLDPRIRYN